MVLLTFTGTSVAKILALEKCATTRVDNSHWRRMVDRIAKQPPAIAHIWAGSPRNGGIKLGEAPLVNGLAGIPGSSFTDRMITLDGFPRAVDLAARLATHYGGPRFEKPLYGESALAAATTLGWFNSRSWTWLEWRPDLFEPDPANVVAVRVAPAYKLKRGRR